MNQLELRRLIHTFNMLCEITKEGPEGINERDRANIHHLAFQEKNRLIRLYDNKNTKQKEVVGHFPPFK